MSSRSCNIFQPHRHGFTICRKPVKVGIFVVQAAGNTGPSPKSMSSFSPWIFTVDSASHDRTYNNSITLGTTSPFLELDLHDWLVYLLSLIARSLHTTNILVVDS